MFTMKKRVLSELTSRVLLGIIHILLLVSSVMFTAGIADQAAYAPTQLCFLTTQAYPTVGGICKPAVTIGTVGIFFSLCLAAVRICFMFQRYSAPPRVAIVFSFIGASWAIIHLVNTMSVNTALKRTCAHLEEVKNMSCADAFSDGFLIERTEKISKNLSIVWYAITAGWTAMVAWATYAIWEFLDFRRALLELSTSETSPQDDATESSGVLKA